MSYWMFRHRWPADPPGHVYLLRAVDMVGAAKLGERWQPPARPTEETATEAGAYDRAWIAGEDFLSISRLVADRCATGELEAIRLDGDQIIAMDANEWLLEHSREGDACFKTGHIFLPNKVLPVFLRQGSLATFIAALAPPTRIVVAEERGSTRQRGRPPVVDWSMVGQEVHRLMDENGEFIAGDPEWNAQACLEGAIADYCETTFSKRPAESVIRDHIRDPLDNWRSQKAEN